MATLVGSYNCAQLQEPSLGNSNYAACVHDFCDVICLNYAGVKSQEITTVYANLNSQRQKSTDITKREEYGRWTLRLMRSWLTHAGRSTLTPYVGDQPAVCISKAKEMLRTSVSATGNRSRTERTSVRSSRTYVPRRRCQAIVILTQHAK